MNSKKISEDRWIGFWVFVLFVIFSWVLCSSCRSSKDVSYNKESHSMIMSKLTEIENSKSYGTEILKDSVLRTLRANITIYDTKSKCDSMGNYPVLANINVVEELKETKSKSKCEEESSDSIIDKDEVLTDDEDEDERRKENFGSIRNYGNLIIFIFILIIGLIYTLKLKK